MKALFVLLIAFAQLAAAQDVPRSISWQSKTIPCGAALTAAGADVMPLDANNEYRANLATPGAPGPSAMPQLPVAIVEVCVTHVVYGDQSGSYAVGGKSGINGDYMTPFFTGSATACRPQNPANPWVLGEHMDVHAGCSTGYHYVVLEVRYVPSAASPQGAPTVVSESSKYLYMGQWVVVLSGTRVGTTVKVRLPNGLISTVDISDLQ